MMLSKHRNVLFINKISTILCKNIGFSREKNLDQTVHGAITT